MKILKLLNKSFFLVIILLISSISSYAEEEPVDIWNIEQKSEIEKLSGDNSQLLPINEEGDESTSEPSIYDLQLKKKNSLIKL